MAEPLGRGETVALLERYGVRLRKALGQHFLADPNTVRRIVELADVGAGSKVVEIGAGAGTLTRGLVDAGAEVIAYEVDEGLRPILEETVGSDAEVRFEDASRVDLNELTGDGDWTMVANLPYNVGTPIVLDALRQAPGIVRFVVMLQRESVDRLAATPGSKEYGVPSVVAALHSEVRRALRVGPDVFVPRPKVDSAVAVLDRRPAAAGSERAIHLATLAFQQRRKMVRTSLRSAVTDEVLTSAGVDPTARAEALSPDDYLALAAAE